MPGKQSCGLFAPGWLRRSAEFRVAHIILRHHMTGLEGLKKAWFRSCVNFTFFHRSYYSSPPFFFFFLFFYRQAAPDAALVLARIERGVGEARDTEEKEGMQCPEIGGARAGRYNQLDSSLQEKGDVSFSTPVERGMVEEVDIFPPAIFSRASSWFDEKRAAVPEDDGACIVSYLRT